MESKMKCKEIGIMLYLFTPSYEFEYIHTCIYYFTWYTFLFKRSQEAEITKLSFQAEIEERNPNIYFIYPTNKNNNTKTKTI